MFVPDSVHSHLGTLPPCKATVWSLLKALNIIKEPKINPDCLVSVNWVFFFLLLPFLVEKWLQILHSDFPSYKSLLSKD